MCTTLVAERIALADIRQCAPSQEVQVPFLGMEGHPAVAINDLVYSLKRLSCCLGAHWDDADAVLPCLGSKVELSTRALYDDAPPSSCREPGGLPVSDASLLKPDSIAAVLLFCYNTATEISLSAQAWSCSHLAFASRQSVARSS